MGRQRKPMSRLDWAVTWFWLGLFTVSYVFVCWAGVV